MLAVTKDYMFAAGNVVLSLKKYMPNKEYDVVIYYDEIDDWDKEILLSYGCILKKYTIEDSFKNEIITKRAEFSDVEKSKHFSFLKFAKFEIFNLLETYEKVIWLDADISVQDDIYELFNFNTFAITQDSKYMVQNNFLTAIPSYKMEIPGVCSSVFLITRAIKNYQEMSNWCYKKILEYAYYLKNIDQGIFNLLLQEFNIEYTLLDENVYNCFSSYDSANTAKIVHFGTPVKVWNNTLIASSFPEWYRTHIKWLRQGGSDFNRSNFPVLNIYAKVIFRDKRIHELENEIKQLNKTIQQKTLVKYKLSILGIKIFSIRRTEKKTSLYLFGFIKLFQFSKK